MSRARWSAGALVLVWVLLAGCSSSSGAGSSDKPSKASAADDAADILKDAKTLGSPEQAEALADGHITVEEMKASIEAYEACLASTDWRLEDVYPDPIRGEPHFSFITTAEGNPGADDAVQNDCELKTFRFVDVFAQTIQGSGPMDPAIRARTSACLDDDGVPTSPVDRTDKEIFITAGKKNMQKVVDCLLGTYRAEFPDRDEISVAVPSEVVPN